LLNRAFEQLQRQQITRIKVEATSLDSTSIKAHPDGSGALKNGPQSIGKSRGGWTTKIHLVAADTRTAISFALSPGHAHDAPEGRQPLLLLGPINTHTYLMMNRAYEGNQTHQLALDPGYIPVVPPKANRLSPWEYDHVMYRKHNEVERLFQRIKGFRRIFSVLTNFMPYSCLSFILPLSLKRLNCVNRPYKYA